MLAIKMEFISGISMVILRLSLDILLSKRKKKTTIRHLIRNRTMRAIWLDSKQS